MQINYNMQTVSGSPVSSTRDVMGAAMGGVVGWLLATGVVAIPLFSPVIAASPVLAAFGGTAAGAFIGSGLGRLLTARTR